MSSPYASGPRPGSNLAVWATNGSSPRLGRFVLGPELGRGGMGTVYAAWDPLLNRKVALKLLHLGDPAHLLRFMREAQIQAKVEHPQICKVFEVGSEGDQPFIAMQFIEGQTLGEAKEELDRRETVRIMAEVAGAIHAAHRLGLVHRDLKPSNILLEPREDGSLKPYVLDFGLARDQSIADQSLSWGFVGTPAFMSPEQARAEEPTPASDIYSLGATLYALLSGHPPFEATSMVGLAIQQSTRPASPLRRTIPGFPKDLDTILLKCLDPQPGRRYGSALGLEEDLRRWLAGEPIHARPVGILERAWRAANRRRALSLAIASGVAVALVLLTWNVLAARRAQRQVGLAQQFALQVREVEQLLRIERMLPAHDIRPAEGRVRQRMEEIRAAMGNLGPVADGPGHYALGRGYLALRDYPAARTELDRAWASGFQSPEVAYSLGTALLNLYLIEEGRIRRMDPSKIQAALEPLQTRFADPALSYFHLARGQFQEDPAYGEAQVAMLERDDWRCIQKCREAFEAKPWMYEAKLLEARALENTVFGRPGEAVPPREIEDRLKEADQAIHAAARVAPSDEQVYLSELRRLTDLSYLQADSGTPSMEVFERTDTLFLQALTIRPGDTQVMLDWITSRVRQGLFRLRQGEDVRPLVKETLQKSLPQGARVREAGRADQIGYLYWILADWQWRHGENPLPALAEADRWFPKDDFGRAQPACLKADFLASRGKDPISALGEGERILQIWMRDKNWSFYHECVYGMILMARAEWAWGQGTDPLADLDRALQHLEASRAMNPDAIHAYPYLALVHTLKAQRSLALGQDPQMELSAALEACRKGLQITSSHYRIHLAMAKAREMQATDLMRHGQDPTATLELAREAVRAGLRANPTSFQILLQSARVDLVAARYSASKGQAPMETLANAEAEARRGLAIKADCPELWLVLAKVERGRVEWARAQGDAVDQEQIQDGVKALKRALGLNPDLPEALAERAALEMIQPGQRENGQKTLAAALKRDPFLDREFRDDR